MSDPPRQPTPEPDCISSRALPVIDATFGVLASLTTLAIAGFYTDASGAERQGADDARYITVAIGAPVAIAFFLSGHVGYGRAERCDAARAASVAAPSRAPEPRFIPTPLVESIAAKDPLAAELTHAAHRAAEQGNCAPTAASGPRVKYLDPVYYEKVFLADAAIARCR